MVPIFEVARRRPRQGTRKILSALSIALCLLADPRWSYIRSDGQNDGQWLTGLTEAPLGLSDTLLRVNRCQIVPVLHAVSGNPAQQLVAPRCGFRLCVAKNRSVNDAVQ